MAMVAMTFCSQTWMGTVAPAQAATVIDTFQFKATLKEWCQGNPKFFQNGNIKAAYNVTLTVTRDVNGDGDYTDVSATIGNSGRETDVIPMKGLAFPRNKSGGKAEFALSGVNPVNADHFISVRGQATFDTLGQMINLTKVTGTVVYQMTGTYAIDKFGTPSAPVECFGSGTLGTGMKLAGH
jgi:hypothetical protein